MLRAEPRWFAAWGLVGFMLTTLVPGSGRSAELIATPGVEGSGEFSVPVIGYPPWNGPLRLRGRQPVGEMTRAFVPIEPMGPRVLRLLRADESVVDVDLEALRHGWPAAENPELRPGDRLSVLPSTSRIDVWGAVESPGERAWVEGDTALEAIQMAGGVRSDAGPMILIHRQGDPEHRFILNRNQPDIMPLVAGDRIFVPAMTERRTPAVVHIRGALHYTGPFPLLEGRDRPLDLVQLAGGPTSDALAKRALLISGAPGGAAVEFDLGSAAAETLSLGPGDTIYVPRR